MVIHGKEFSRLCLLVSLYIQYVAWMGELNKSQYKKLLLLQCIQFSSIQFMKGLLKFTNTDLWTVIIGLTISGSTAQHPFMQWNILECP